MTEYEIKNLNRGDTLIIDDSIKVRCLIITKSLTFPDKICVVGYRLEDLEKGEKILIILTTNPENVRFLKATPFCPTETELRRIYTLMTGMEFNSPDDFVKCITQAWSNE